MTGATIAAIARRTGVALLAAAALYVVASTVHAVTVLRLPIAYWDMWEFVLHMQRWVEGSYGLADLWSQHNEHRLVLPRLLFFTDYLAFGGTEVFLTASTLVIQALHAVVLFLVLRRSAEVGVAGHLAALAFVVLCLFSAQQMENLTWGFQVQWVLTYLAMTCAAGCLSLAAARDSGPWLAGACLAATCATCSMANGILVWPILIAMSLALRMRAKRIATLCGVAVLVGAAYFWDFYNIDGHSDPVGSLLAPHRVLFYSLSYLGNPVAGIAPEPVVWTLGATALLVTVVFTWRAVRQRLAPAKLPLLAIMWFIIGTSLVTALGRIDFGYHQALISRYTTPSLILWVGCFGLVLPELAKLRARASLRLVVTGAFAGVIALLIAGQSSAFRHFSDKRDRVALGALALVTGVEDPDSIKQVYPWPAEARIRADFLQKHGLSVFAAGRHERIGEPLEAHYRVDRDGQAAGSFDAATLLPRGPAGAKVAGWTSAATRESVAGDSLVDVVIATGDERIVGYGQVVGRRRGRDRVRWEGYVRHDDEDAELYAWVSGPNGEALRRLPGVPQVLVRSSDQEERDGDTARFRAIRSGHWLPDTLPEPAPRPPFAGSYYASWAGNDAHSGELRMKEITVQPGRRLSIPFLTGPDVTGLSLRIVEGDRTVVALTVPATADSWENWRVPAKRLAGCRAIEIVAEDRGTGWGQWLAVGYPRWVD